MKIEIEVSEDEFKKYAEGLILSEIRKKAQGWGTDAHIKARVAAHWERCVDVFVLEALENSEELREKIAHEIERKLRAQITVAMNAASKAPRTVAAALGDGLN